MQFCNETMSVSVDLPHPPIAISCDSLVDPKRCLSIYGAMPMLFKHARHITRSPQAHLRTCSCIGLLTAVLCSTMNRKFYQNSVASAGGGGGGGRRGAKALRKGICLVRAMSARVLPGSVVS